MNKENIPAQPCPRCQYPQDTAEVPDKPDVQPGPGDVSICLNCGDLLRFNDAMMLVVPTADEEVQMYLDFDLKQRRIVHTAQKYIKERGRFWPKLLR